MCSFSKRFMFLQLTSCVGKFFYDTLWLWYNCSTGRLWSNFWNRTYLIAEIIFGGFDVYQLYDFRWFKSFSLLAYTHHALNFVKYNLERFGLNHFLIFLSICLSFIYTCSYINVVERKGEIKDINNRKSFFSIYFLFHSYQLHQPL